MSSRRLLANAKTRNRVLVALVIAVIVVAAAGCLARASLGSDSADAAVLQGRQVFVANCTACHGDKGDRVPIAPLNSKEFLESRGDATLVHVISEGKGVMPAWGIARGGPLSSDQISSLVAYLNATAGRTSPTILASSGRSVFQQQCVRCHGDKGDRIPVAPLAAKPFVDSRTDAQLFEVISDGNGMMPAFVTGSVSPLNEEQVRAVISYLRYNAEVGLAEEARRGRDLYVGNCLACHGERGDRVPNVALASSEQLRRLGDGTITSVVAEGKGVMPGFLPAKGGSFQVGDVGAVLAYLKSWAGLPAGSALVGPEVPSQGRDVYLKNCTGCHGEGGDKVAGVALKSHAFLDGMSDDTLQRSIGQGNSRGMPAWGQPSGGPLSDTDIKSIVDYLRSVALGASGIAGQSPTSLTPAAVGNAPVASDTVIAKGKDTFTKNCVACHGETRDKIPTAKLADGSWIQQRGDAALSQTITNGKGAMPSWGKEKGGPLRQDDISAILAYLKSASGATPSGSSGASGAPAAATPAGVAAQGGSASLTGDAAKAQDIFTKNCVACHGATRDKIAAAKLADGQWLQQQGDATLTQIISNGKGSMPSWGKDKGGSLGQDDIAAVLAYLKAAAGVGQKPAANGQAPASNAGANNAPAQPSAAPATTPTPAAPLSASEPVLAGDAVKGKDIFTQNCVACHGATRDKIAAAKLADGAWLQQRGDATLTGSITNGKGPMPKWGKVNGGPLAPDDIAAVLLYLKAAAGLGGG